MVGSEKKDGHTMTFSIFAVNSVLVIVGGFFGAVSRFGVSQWIDRRFFPVFPYGTLIVNLTGAFLLGIIIGADLSTTWQLLLGIGFMGAFTTFSAFKLENIQLGVHKKWKVLAGYLAVSYIGGVFLAFLGLTIGMS